MTNSVPNEEGQSEARSSQESAEEDSLIGSILPRTRFPGAIPEFIEQYNQLPPEAADRILKMAEEEQVHRHNMEKKLIDAQISDQKQERRERRLGQWFGLIIGLTSVVAGSTTAILGSPISGGFIGSAGVVGLVSAFVAGRRERSKETK
jgi:uncharacterized membrane protein